MYINNKIWLLYFCCLGMLLLAGCSTVKKKTVQQLDYKPSEPEKQQLPNSQSSGRLGIGNENGKGKQGTGSGNNSDKGGGENGTDGSGEGADNGKVDKKVTGDSLECADGDGTTKDEVTGFLNLEKTESAKHKTISDKLLTQVKSTSRAVPLSDKPISKDTHKVQPSPDAGRRLISDLKKNQIKEGSHEKAPPALVLDAPRRKTTQFSAPPPVIKKVNDSFMPYKKGQVIALDTNLVPAKKSGGRMICLYSGASVYLSFKYDAVKMDGLYVKGKFKVKEIIQEKFSGKYVPVAVLDKL